MTCHLVALTVDALDPRGLAGFWSGVLGRPAVEDRDGEGHARQHGADMGRHVVRALGAVDVAGVARRQPVEGGEEVGLHVGIGIFLDGQGGRGVPAEHGDEPGADAAAPQPGGRWAPAPR